MEATQSLINSCGKLFPEWITPLKPPVCQSMERCYICGCCEISLNTKEVWKSHQGIHRKVRPSVCDQCGKTFQTQTAGHFHYKHFYTTDRQDQSPFCERAECKKTYMFQYQLKMQQ